MGDAQGARRGREENELERADPHQVGVFYFPKPFRFSVDSRSIILYTKTVQLTKRRMR